MPTHPPRCDHKKWDGAVATQFKSDGCDKSDAEKFCSQQLYSTDMLPAVSTTTTTAATAANAGAEPAAGSSSAGSLAGSDNVASASRSAKKSSKCSAFLDRNCRIVRGLHKQVYTPVWLATLLHTYPAWLAILLHTYPA